MRIKHNTKKLPVRILLGTCQRFRFMAPGLSNISLTPRLVVWWIFNPPPFCRRSHWYPKRAIAYNLYKCTTTAC